MSRRNYNQIIVFFSLNVKGKWRRNKPEAIYFHFDQPSPICSFGYRQPYAHIVETRRHSFNETNDEKRNGSTPSCNFQVIFFLLIPLSQEIELFCFACFEIRGKKRNDIMELRNRDPILYISSFSSVQLHMQSYHKHGVVDWLLWRFNKNSSLPSNCEIRLYLVGFFLIVRVFWLPSEVYSWLSCGAIFLTCIPFECECKYWIANKRRLQCSIFLLVIPPPFSNRFVHSVCSWYFKYAN